MSSRQHYPPNPTPFPSTGAHGPTDQATGLFASQARRIYINLSRYAIEYLEHTGRARDNELLHHLMEQALYTAVTNGRINEPMRQEILRLMGRYLAGGRPRTITTSTTAVRSVTVVRNSTTGHAPSNQHQRDGGTKEQEAQNQEKEKEKGKETELDEGSSAGDATEADVSDSAAGSAMIGSSKRSSNRRSRNHKPGTSLVDVLAQMSKRDV